MNLIYPQSATYWGAPTPNGFGGNTWTPPKSLMVRWEEKNEEFIDLQGNTKISQAVVFAQQDLDVGGYLLLGDSPLTDPTLDNNAMVIQRYSKIPDLRAVQFNRKAWL